MKIIKTNYYVHYIFLLAASAYQFRGRSLGRKGVLLDVGSLLNLLEVQGVIVRIHTKCLQLSQPTIVGCLCTNLPAQVLC